MSDAHTETPEAPLAKVLNVILNFAVPGILLIMLGFVGFKFITGMGDTEEERAEAARLIAEAQAAKEAAAAPDGGGAPAPAPGDGGAAPAAADAGGVPAELMALGKSTYATCAACHGPDGQGLQAGPAKMAPSLTNSEVLMGDPDGAILVILKGIQKEGMDYMGIMAALGAGLNDEQIAAVLTYCRNEFDNKGDAITTEQVAAAREKYADLNAPAGVKRSEINSIVESHK